MTRKPTDSRRPLKMSAFSRGLFSRLRCASKTCQPLQTFSSRGIQLRVLSSSAILCAAKKNTVSKSISIPKAFPTSSKIPISSIPYQSFAASLAQKTYTTTLYEAPSHRWYIWTSYGAASFFAIYASYVIYVYMDAPEGVPVWVPYVFGGCGFAMAVFAARLALNVAGLVKSINAIPKSVLMASKNPAIARSAAKGPDLTIEVELRKMLPIPFFPARKLYAEPNEIVIPHSLAPPAVVLSPSELRARERQEEARRKKELKYEQSHIMSAGLRHASRAFFTLFTNARRAWTREGFMDLKVKKRFYKMDVLGGYALDNGRAIDRLVTIKKNTR
ncbi:hypothetical protein BGZ60DRAFT_434221 [Tricladium varicosporioides]|nr:hypothetical protein BGZ60DRAFT_434221 [Hymenoscyphus varicosporioides]